MNSFRFTDTPWQIWWQQKDAETRRFYADKFTREGDLNPTLRGAIVFTLLATLGLVAFFSK